MSTWVYDNLLRSTQQQNSSSLQKQKDHLVVRKVPLKKEKKNHINLNFRHCYSPAINYITLKIVSGRQHLSNSMIWKGQSDVIISEKSEWQQQSERSSIPVNQALNNAIRWPRSQQKNIQTRKRENRLIPSQQYYWHWGSADYFAIAN